MALIDAPSGAPLSRRLRGTTSSPVRDILKVASRPEVISLAGGLPAPETFDVAGLRAAFDEVLAGKYRNVMTPEEEYYYANDFGGRFRNQIMQPREICTDPAWGRLHPAVEECMAELRR